MKKNEKDKKIILQKLESLDTLGRKEKEKFYSLVEETEHTIGGYLDGIIPRIENYGRYKKLNQFLEKLIKKYKKENT